MIHRRPIAQFAPEIDRARIARMSYLVVVVVVLYSIMGFAQPELISDLFTRSRTTIPILFFAAFFFQTDRRTALKLCFCGVCQWLVYLL